MPSSAFFNFKGLFILLILIYGKIRLFLAADCPSGPCKNCSLYNFARVCPTITRKSFLNVVHFFFCPKQGMYMYFKSFFLSNKQDQGFKPSAAHLYANINRMPPSPSLPPPPPSPTTRGNEGNVKCQLIQSRKYNSSIFSY